LEFGIFWFPKWKLLETFGFSLFCPFGFFCEHFTSDSEKNAGAE